MMLGRRAVSVRAGGFLLFYSSLTSLGISCLHAFHASHRPSSTVETVSLAPYLRQHGVGQLKSDAEEHGLAVSDGFPWKNVKPVLGVVEYEDAKTLDLGHSWTELAKLLWNQGYRILVSEWHPVAQYGETHRWKAFGEYPGYVPSPQGWGNLAAVRPQECPHVSSLTRRLAPSWRSTRTQNLLAGRGSNHLR